MTGFNYEIHGLVKKGHQLIYSDDDMNQIISLDMDLDRADILPILQCQFGLLHLSTYVERVSMFF